MSLRHWCAAAHALHGTMRKTVGPRKPQAKSALHAAAHFAALCLVPVTCCVIANAVQVRYVFEGQDAPGQKRRQDAQRPAQGGENESLQAMKRVLRNVTVHEKAVITGWCSRNAGQMRAALESVSTLQEQAAEMERDLSASHQGLRVRPFRCWVGGRCAAMVALLGTQ